MAKLPPATPTSAELITMGQAFWLAVTKGTPQRVVFVNESTGERKAFVVIAYEAPHG